MNWQVECREMSYSEPMLTRRKPDTDIKTGGVSILREQGCASGVRRLVGMTLYRALCGNPSS